MTTETDCLAKIAAKTVECRVCEGDGQHQWLGEHDVEVENCPDCKGSGRVLDPRFKGLRDTRCLQDRQHRMIYHSSIPTNCPGYTVVRDLAVLLEIAPPNRAISLYNKPSGGWACNIFGLHGEADTPLEAAAKAFWEWLEAEEKEHSDG